MFEDRPFDVRLVYLAVRHILKKRGHFLFGDVALEDVTFASCLETLGEYLRDKYDLAFALADAQAFASALTDRSLNATRKRAALAAAAGDVAKDKQIAAVIDLLAGRKASAAALCAMEIEEDRKFSFKEGFDNAEAELADLLGETMPLVYHVKRLYDWSVLDELRAGERFLSEAKVKAYERHKSDLKRLRALLRPFPQAYKEMFRRAKEKLDNYAAYSGHGAAKYRCTYEKFCAYVKKQLNALRGDMDAAAREEADRVLGEMETGAFLPKQTTTDNGVIPHQLHEQELRVILERAARYLPFLSEVDESGLSAGEKILAIFRFRIPYYVGPLDTRSEHSWAVRTHEKIYPWNFDQVVDRARSAQRFIERMTAKCSYIGEPVLPRDSLLYSRFVALNMLNKLRVNGHPISVETKQRIYNECILQNACTRGKQLRDYLLSNGLMQKGDELTGMDEQFRISMTGYQVFRALPRARATPSPWSRTSSATSSSLARTGSCWKRGSRPRCGERLSTRRAAPTYCAIGTSSAIGAISLGDVPAQDTAHRPGDGRDDLHRRGPLAHQLQPQRAAQHESIRSSTRWSNTAPSVWARKSRPSRTYSRTATHPRASDAPSTRASPSSARSKNSWANRPSACSSK